jgi:hypothetical protein
MSVKVSLSFYKSKLLADILSSVIWCIDVLLSYNVSHISERHHIICFIQRRSRLSHCRGEIIYDEPKNILLFAEDGKDSQHCFDAVSCFIIRNIQKCFVTLWYQQI